MAELRSNRPTPADDARAEAAGDPSQDKATSTIRAAGDEHPTLRLGGTNPEPGGLPPWRARYDDLGELARGGMSTVRMVFDKVIRRRVAMKVHDRERDPGGLPHFLEEARITGQLDHPHVVPVHDVQYDERGLPTRFTMKLVEGETLAEMIERRGARPLQGEEFERMLGVVIKICDAVGFAHSRGVIHCDIKPSNILVGSHGQVYLTDWGVAVRREAADADPSDRSTMPFSDGTLCGTPAYMAPEQAWSRRQDIDERTDVYGLGGVLYAMMTLTPPHDGGGTAADLELAKRGAVRRPPEVVKERPLPPGLCRIAMRALSADPLQRYPSVELLKLDLERFMRGGGWFESIRLPKGTWICQRGRPARRGVHPDGRQVRAAARRGRGQDASVTVLEEGEVFGETAIFGSSVRTASILALTDVTLVRVTRDALQRELERTEWLKTFVESLAERFIELDLKVRELESKNR